MSDDVWTGLADVRPLPEAESLEDAMGAYVRVVSVAGDDADFARRTAEALEAQGLELVGLEEAEPLQAYAEPAGVGADLIEMVVAAVRTSEVVLGELHPYHAEVDDDEPAQEALDALVGSGRLVDVERDEEWDRLSGFLVAASEEWLLLNVVDDGGRADGWAALRRIDVESTAARDPETDFMPRALEARGVAAAADPGVDLGSIEALLASAQALTPLLVVYLEAVDPEILYIGRVVRTEGDEVLFQTVDPAGRWAEIDRYRLSRITRLEWGGSYEEALALVTLP